MLENIVRHIEEGMPPFEAALKGSGEIGFTIVSITISLVAVFIPVLLMGGVVGRIFNEFAVVVTISIVASALVSLTLTPMLARAPAGAAAGTAQRGATCSSAASTACSPGYRGAARPLPARRGRSSSLVFLASVAATVWLFRDIPKGFFPQEDIGQLSVYDRGAPGHLLPGHAGAAARGRGGAASARPTSRMSPRSSAAAGATTPSTRAASSSS